MNLCAIVGHIKSDVGHVQEIIGEVLLDDVTLITAANHEIVDAMCGVYLHDVPQNRFAPDFNHRFGREVGFF